MENTIWSIVPPLLAIIMVLITKRVLISLGTGIVAAAFIIANFNLMESLLLIWQSFKEILIVNGALDTWNIYIILFIFLLGILTTFVSMIGGTLAFGDWMIHRVKTRTGAQLMTLCFGITIFVDDYFNSLTVGPVSRPVTDKHRVSRAKLAYIVDSTSAPISVIAPISSWGAYIIGIIGVVLIEQNVTEYSAFEAFIKIIPMNFYVWSAVGMVIVIAISQRDFGPMKIHEKHALETGNLTGLNDNKKVAAIGNLPISDIGRLSDLLIPIGSLFVGTLLAFYMSGSMSVEGERTLTNIFGAADVALALLIGGTLGMVVTLLMSVRHFKQGKLPRKSYRLGVTEGLKSMTTAVTILIFAWAISSLIDKLQTGSFLAGVVESSNINIVFLPVLVFIMAGFIAFSTGTSWGSFAILLPIAGQISGTIDITLLLPVLAAVLGGAVFGDHCSPISDTTILSSTGAGCDHMDHVTTQLPYALVAAVITGIGYIALGVSGSVWLGLLTVILGLTLVFGILKSTKE